MLRTNDLHNRRDVLLGIVVAGWITAAIVAIFVFAPKEVTMGDAQRILYVHVSVAWFGLLSFVVMAATGLMYLFRRDLAWDHWSQAAGELGWLCLSLTLVTGSLWAHAAWQTWWTWDPRLTTSFILWAIFSGYLIVRVNVEDPHRRARLGAVLAIVGMLDVPVVVVAARRFRGMHPATAEMEPAMRVVLLLSVIGFSVLLTVLLLRRRTQLRLQSLLDALQQRAEEETFPSIRTDDGTY